MSFSGKDFQILDALDSGDICTQRQLSDHTGISLGQINYVLRRLLDKGFVKVGNFRKNPNKLGYIYKLTPKGIETRSRLAVSFVVKRLGEYRELKSRLVVRLADFEKNGLIQVVFVGPAIVKEFIETIIRTESMKLRLVEHLESAEEMARRAPPVFDAVLLFDASSESLDGIANDSGVPREKLKMLW
ncbi:MAG: MarR family EPS-associated transcriptional regulator [Pseudomonadota bacterium]